MKKIKQIVAGGISVVVVLYFFSCTLFMTYFNYTYAKENGFVKWLILGQIVPTAKGVVWPYYIFFKKNS